MQKKLCGGFKDIKYDIPLSHSHEKVSSHLTYSRRSGKRSRMRGGREEIYKNFCIFVSSVVEEEQEEEKGAVWRRAAGNVGQGAQEGCLG